MTKPGKKELFIYEMDGLEGNRKHGYNQACYDWEKWMEEQNSQSNRSSTKKG